MKLKKPLLVTMVLVAVVSSLYSLIERPVMQKKELNVLFPFVFSNSVDPRKIVTVGDQILSEHLFAFHARESIRGGFESVYSDVDIDREKRTITLTPKYNIDSLDKTSTIQFMCDSFKESLSISSHVILKPLIQDISCDQGKIIVKLKEIPVNISYLFTLADYSIFNKNNLPIVKDETKYSEQTGPYNLVGFSERKISLKINKNYPSSLRANNIENVNLISYEPNATEDLIHKLDPKKNDLAYLYGYSMTRDLLDQVKEKEYKVRQMPSEWIVYIGMNNSFPLELRNKLLMEMTPKVGNILESSPLGQRAYGFSPSNRPFGLDKVTFEKTLEESTLKLAPKDVSKKYTLATLDEWAKIPVFSRILSEIKSKYSDLIEIKEFSRENIGEIWSEEMDMFLSPLGIAPSDPISTFAFLYELRDIISEKEILEASLIKDQEAFTMKLLEFEKRILKDRRIITFGHYPGIVLESPYVNRDQKLAWSWGVQAWTYKVH